MAILTACIWAFFVLAMAWLMWGFHCIEVTGRERSKLLPKAGDPQFWPKLQAFQQVSFWEHLHAREWFRDPMKLYPEILRDTSK